MNPTQTPDNGRIKAIAKAESSNARSLTELREKMNQSQTPDNEVACPNCGDQQWYTFSNGHHAYKCWSTTEKQSELCREREAHRKTREELRGEIAWRRAQEAALDKSEAENQKLRELLDGTLVALERAVNHIKPECNSSYKDALSRLQNELNQLTK